MDNQPINIADSKPIKYVQKDCGKHWGPTPGPCAKCSGLGFAAPSSLANSLEGTVTLSNGVKVEYTSKGKI